MCLIIAGQAGKIRNALLNTEGMLLDIFKSNPDGIGIMYAKHHKGIDQLKIFKKLPKSLEQARLFIERMPNDERQLAIHFRWTTHGDTDLLNCHPYVVVEGEVALMHNGVLSTGNSADTTKSDTWHFIKDYLHNAVKMAPGLVFDPGFVALVKDFIGNNNRFVFMGKDGRMTIVNKKEGIEHDGLWFSNTYAWRPSVFISNFRSGWNGSTYYPPTRTRGTWYHGMGDDDDYGGYGVWEGGRYGSYGGTQSGSGKSGVTHNTPALPPSPAPASAGGPAPQGTYTQADAEADAEWERTVRNAHKEWQRDQRATAPVGGSVSSHVGTSQDRSQDPPEEGAQGGQRHARQTSGHEVVDFAPPSRGELIEALTDANVDMFDKWLAEYGQYTIGILFHLYKAAPTRFTDPEKDLSRYEREVYAACLAADKNKLIAECRRDDGSSAAVAEVICYHLNWLAWPEANVVSQLRELQKAPALFPKTKTITVDGVEFTGPKETTADVQQAIDAKDAAHVETGGSNGTPEISAAQTGQGGDADRDGYAETSVYLG